MCTDSATAHDALDEALELSVNTGGGPDQEIVDVESHQQRSTTFDVMETSEEEKTKKYHTTPTEATQNPFFVHPAIYAHTFLPMGAQIYPRVKAVKLYKLREIRI